MPNALINGAFGKFLSELGTNGALSTVAPLIALGGVASAASGGANTVANLVADRYKNMNEPTWKAMGESKLYQENPELVNYQKAQEALMKLKYEKPVDIGSNLAEKAIGGMGSNMSGMLEEARARNAFNQISGSPIVQALGEDKARNIYDQLSAIAPGLIRKAPGTALSVMTRSMDEGGQATIDPNMAMQLTRAAGELNKI